MVGFQEYFETMVGQKPEWRNAFIDYPSLAALLNRIRRGIHVPAGRTRTPDPGDGQAQGTGARPAPRPEVRNAIGRSTSFDNVESWLKPYTNALSPRQKGNSVDGGDEKGNENETAPTGPHASIQISDLRRRRARSDEVDETHANAVRCAPPKHHDTARRGAERRESSPSDDRQRVATPSRGPAVGPAGKKVEMEDEGGAGIEMGGDVATVPPPTSSQTDQLPKDSSTVLGASPSLILSVDDVPNLDPLAASFSVRPTSQTRGMTRRTSFTNLAKSFCPQPAIDISDDALRAAEDFESLLQSEIEKAQTFLKLSASTLSQYFHEKATHPPEEPVFEGQGDGDTALKVKSLLQGLKHTVSPLHGASEDRRLKDNLRYLYGELRHLVHFAETNHLAVKTLLHGYRAAAAPYELRPEMDDAALLVQLFESEDEVNRLKLAVEVYWADRYSGGSVSTAQGLLQEDAATAAQAFKAGFFTALVITSFLYWLHIWFELSPDSETQEHFSRAFPMMRMILSVFFAFVCWSGVLYVFHRCRINYLYVFEFSQTVSMTWMMCFEYGIVMLFLGCLACCLYIRSELQRPDSYEGAINGFREASPWIFPALFGIFGLSIALPPRAVFRRTRNCLFRVIRNCCKLPWGTVRFVDFFVADWGTSLPIVLGDALYVLCYYTALQKESLYNSAPADLTCDTTRAHWWFILAMVPFWWRACQTIKMYQRTRQRVHLINHGKYLSMIIAFVAQMWFAWAPSDSASAIVWLSRILSQLYAFVWDVLMDWGWIRGSHRGRMFKGLWPCALAVVLDFAGRLYFIPVKFYIVPLIGQEKTLFLQAVLEVLRRSMWSIFRIENENLNNLETYRSIDFVPTVVIPT